MTWTFELNNQFGVKFYRGNRTVMERLIASKYIEDILDTQKSNFIRGYCMAEGYLTVKYAQDGENYETIFWAQEPKTIVSFDLEHVSFVSKLRFNVFNTGDESAYVSGLICTIYVRGKAYSTSTDSSYWSIVDESSEEERIIMERDAISSSTIETSRYMSDDAQWIWNPNLCAGQNDTDDIITQTNNRRRLLQDPDQLILNLTNFSSSSNITKSPTPSPTTKSPTATPSTSPSISPTKYPTSDPTMNPTQNPTILSCTIEFEFSFENVDNPDNAPSFYFEWDADDGDYMRFGFYNDTNKGLEYYDNFDMIMEVGYTSNFKTYFINQDGKYGNDAKIYIHDVIWSIANESYNIDWFVDIDILNTTDPKPCFGYDLLEDKLTRITQQDLITDSLWKDDGRAMSWKLNGNTFPGWHTIKYLNITDNITYNKEELYPYYFHHPFVSSQESWQRSFVVDSNIHYDYTQIELDIYTFCGWDYKTDSVSVELAFEEYLDFVTFWNSTHASKNCKGHNSPAWNDVYDIVRMNKDIQSDLTCYNEELSEPSFKCSLDAMIHELNENKENDGAIVECQTYTAGVYELILDHKDVDIGFFNKTSLRATGLENEDDPSANTYSIIGYFDEEKRSQYIDDNGNYKFKLIYYYTDGKMDELIWTQKSWVTDSTITGANLSMIQQTVTSECTVFYGLGLSRTADPAYLDGNGGTNWTVTNCWFNAVGTFQSFSNGIPAFDGKIASSVSLYILKPTSSNFTVYYAQDGTQFTDVSEDGSIKVDQVNRYSKLQIDVERYNSSTLGGLKCSILINNETRYYTNADDRYWTIISSTDNNTNIVNRDGSDPFFVDEPVYIWNTDNNTAISHPALISFQFDFYFVFINEYNLTLTNENLNMTNESWITQMIFEAGSLTNCQLKFYINDTNVTSIRLCDNSYLSSDEYDSELMPFINNKDIDQIEIELLDFAYNCRLELYSECGFNGNITRLDGIYNDSFMNNILTIENTSSWILYSDEGHECYATFSVNNSNITYTIEAQDGGFVSDSCNTVNSFDLVELETLKAHYGCTRHVRFQAPNTMAQPFVIKIAADVEDISTKFGEYKKSWGFGNLTITPLVCADFSNIVPLRTPFTLSGIESEWPDEPKLFKTKDVTSLEYEYLFMLIDNMELEILFGDYDENNCSNYSFRIFMNENECLFENALSSEIISCQDNTHYNIIYDTIISDNQEAIIWFSWDPFAAEFDDKIFSFGIGSQLNEQVIGSLNIYGDVSRGINCEINYVAINPPASEASLTVSIMQFATPKICLSKLAELNKIDLGNTWNDDCDQVNWELRKKIQIYDDTANFYGEQEDAFFNSPITDLSRNSITGQSSQCFHGPFGGSDSTNITNFGDYISRHFYVLTDVARDIIHVDMDYYSFSTWNPEQYENDTAYLFIDHNAIWKSSPQYEFVQEYCQGYDIYSDWTLSTEYDGILTQDLIPSLSLLNQKCKYPVSVDFRHEGENALYFSLGISAKLNQRINNEAFGFSNVVVTYHDCPEIDPLPIGNVIKQPFKQLDSYAFSSGDMLIINSNSMYYLVAKENNDTSGSCTFILFGGYKMWSQNSSDCTIAGLEIMDDYVIDDDFYDSLEAVISNEGVLSLQNEYTEEIVWSRRTPCDIDDAYYYYSFNKTNSMRYFKGMVDNSIYSIDCKWGMVITRDGPIVVVKNVNETNDFQGEVVWSNGTEIEKLEFDEDGSLVLYDITEDDVEQNYTLSPKGADFLVFDEGKLVLFDFETDEIIKQFDYELSECILDEDIGEIKYHYYMKPDDILWNGQALISENCQYKLILSDGVLKILDGSSNIIWQPDLQETGAERIEFRKDGNIVVLSYSSDQDILFETESSTLLDGDNIYSANRAILTNDGEFIVTDNFTFNVYYNSSNKYNFVDKLNEEYNYNLDCESDKYQFVDKRVGFYATWMSYFNCDNNNKYIYGETTSCIDYKYCWPSYEYENVFLRPSSVETNCRLYAVDEWKQIKNNYFLFQISVANTEVLLKPEISILLTTSRDIEFGKEFDEKYLKYRTMLITISPYNHTIRLKTKNHSQEFYNPSLFETSNQVEWLWIDWDNNFDYIGIGNSQFMIDPIFTTYFSDFFKSKDKPMANEYLFDYVNIAWDTITNECYGEVAIQFPPSNVEIPKACYDTTDKYISPNNIHPTVGPTFEPTAPTTSPTDNPTTNPTTSAPTTYSPTTYTPTTSVPTSPGAAGGVNHGSSDNGGQNSPVWIFLIVIGVLIICILAAVYYFVYLKRKKNDVEESTPELEKQGTIPMVGVTTNKTTGAQSIALDEEGSINDDEQDVEAFTQLTEIFNELTADGDDAINNDENIEKDI